MAFSFGRLRRWLPLTVAVVATVVSVVLATIPNRGGQYDAALAVLTATLIAIIWYTYFTFQILHRLPLAYLRTRVGFHVRSGGYAVVPKVRNPMERVLRTRLYLEVWIDRRPIDLGPFYRGEVVQPMNPKETFSGWLELWYHLELKPSMDVVSSEILARFRCTWDDGLGNSGETSPLHLRWDIPRDERYSVVGPEIKQRFGTLPSLTTAPGGAGTP